MDGTYNGERVSSGHHRPPQPTPSADRYENGASAKVGAGGPNLRTEDLGPLDRIAARVGNVSDYLHGIANSLDAHADRVHGTQPQVVSAAGNDLKRDRSAAALNRIFEALDLLDQARERLANTAERNVTLA